MLLELAAIAATCIPVKQIEVPAEAPAKRTIEYEELWRTDPESDEYLIGRVGKMITDDDKNLYVFEHQLTEILKFDANGNYLGIIVRKGQGPGEIEKLTSMEFWPPDTLVLLGGFPPRTVRVSTDGVPQDGLHVYRIGEEGSEVTINKLRPVGDHAVIQASNPLNRGNNGLPGHTEVWVGVIDREGDVLHELASTTRPFEINLKVHNYDELEQFWMWQRWTAASPGYVFVAPEREEWRVERRSLDGTVDLVMYRDVEPRRRTPEELAEREERHGKVFRRMGMEFEGKFAQTDPVLRWLKVIDGRLWIPCSMRSGDRPENHFARYEVFMLDGELVEQVDVFFDIEAFDYEKGRDMFLPLPQGRAVVIKNGSAVWKEQIARISGEAVDEESDAPVIVMYREKR